MKQPIQTLREEKYRLINSLDYIDEVEKKERQLIINKYMLAIDLLETLYPPDMELRMRDYVYTPDSIAMLKHNIIEKWDRNVFYQTDEGDYPEFYILFDPNPKTSSSLDNQPSKEFKKRSKELKGKLIANILEDYPDPSVAPSRIIKIVNELWSHDVVKGCR